MALQFSEMYTEVLDNLGRELTSQTRSGVTMQAMSKRWVNRAQRSVASKYDLLYKAATASTIADLQTYAFPSNLRSCFSIRLEDGLQSRKLTCIMPWEFDRLVPKPNELTTDRPSYYIPCKTNNQFELFPIPDSAYVMRMRCSLWPSDLVNDTDYTSYQTSGIEIDEAIILLATGYGFSFLQELVDAREWIKRGYEMAASMWKSENFAFPDWAPRGHGFSTAESKIIGEYYNDPFITKDP